MAKIFVSGLINIESSLKVNEFPINYSPIEYPFFGISTSISGVGYNIIKALKALEDKFSFYSIIGNDPNGRLIKETLIEEGLDTSGLTSIEGEATAESIILVDQAGNRKIYCDLKNIQNLIPFDKVDNINEYDLAILTNINFSRPLLKHFKNSGVLIASDVHVLSNLEDEYNKDFLANADILFLSNEACFDRENEIIKEIFNKYHNKIIVIGCGNKGALAYVGEEDRYYFSSAKAPLGVKNTVGAGDALFSSFIHYYLKTKDVQKSLDFATMFAGIKIASSGGSNGFLSEQEIEEYLDNY